jgi:diguanylate cyclase (GGDEF)-like protein
VVIGFGITDVLARLGGDEFALLLPETNYESAKVLLKRLQGKLALENQVFPATYSIGAITFLQLPNTVDEIVERADRLMYEVKHSSKNALRHEILDSFSYCDRVTL